MNKSLIKKTGLFLILLVIGAIALFPKEIVLRCIAWQTASYCRKAFGARLDYETLAWEEDKIVIKKGRLYKEGELDVTFESAALIPFVDLKQRKFGGELSLQQLKIVHQKKELRPVPNPPSPSFLPFTLQLDTQIVNGELFLYDHLSRKNFLQHAYFDLSHHVTAKQTSGSIAFALNPKAPKLVTHFFKEQGGQLELAASFKSQSFPLLSHLVTYFFQSYLPEPILQWDILKGAVNGQLEMALTQGVPLKLKAKVDFEGVSGENRQLKLLTEMDHLGCNLDIDFSNISAIHGFLDLKGGRVALQEQGTMWEGVWDLKNVHSNISIKEGKIESSSLVGTFLGMEGEMLLDWQAYDILMQIGFRGPSKKISSLLSAKMKESFAEAFPDDFFALDAVLKRSAEGLKLEGELAITDKNELPPYTLRFGCHLGETDPETETLYLQPVDFSLSRSVAIFLDNLKKQFCLSQRRFGWFSAESFPLAKFISPFLLKATPLSLSGIADFKGTFDDNYLVVFYEGKNFELESPHFNFQVDTVKERPGVEMTAVHYIDLKTGSHVGFLPLKDASYWQKNYDFHLEKTAAVVNFENSEIHIQNIMTESDSVEFRGAVNLDIHSLTDVDLKITVSNLKGSACNTQKFLSHFKPSFIWQLPIEGFVSGSDEPVFFHYHFAPTALLVEGHVQGDVCLTTSNPLFTLQEYRASIFYDCKKNTLRMNAGEGKLVLSNQPKEFLLQTSMIHLWDFPNFLMDFSLSLQADSQPCLTLQGSLRQASDGKEISIWGEGQDPFKTVKVKALQKGKAVSVSEYICGNWFGEADVEFGTNGWTIQKIQCNSLQEKGFNLSGEDLLCIYSSNSGLSVEGLEVEIPGETGSEKYKLGRIQYDLKKQKILFESFDFSLPVEKFPWVAKTASELFPGKVSPMRMEWMEALKKNGPLEGKMSLEIDSKSMWVYLSLKDGDYFLSDKKFTFKNFYLVYSPQELQIKSQVFFQDAYYWAHLITDSIKLSSGTFSLSEHGGEGIVAFWQRSRENKWRVEKIKGIFCGLEVDLTQNDRFPACVFEGKVGVDPQKIPCLLPPSWRKTLEELCLSGNYVFEGNLKFEELVPLTCIFSGKVYGNHCQVKGVEIENFSSFLHCERNLVKVTQLMLKDWAGRFFANQFVATKNAQSEWRFSLDYARLADLRLSRLKSPWTQWAPKEKPFFRHLYVPSCILENVSGELSNLETISATGKGEFTNLPKKTLISSLLFIPTEITARIGLDFSTLIPVRGSIEYVISNGKIFLTDLDMYSDGKRSRFYSRRRDQMPILISKAI